MAYVRMTVHRDKNVMSYYVSVSEQISTIPPTQLLLRIRLLPHKKNNNIFLDLYQKSIYQKN
jgi:hypothetical protein